MRIASAAAWARMIANMAGFFGTLARHTASGETVETDALSAAIVPACPDRSVVNSVVYSDTAALGASLDALADAYERAGVRAWTVWVPEHDREAASLLARAGHVLDAQPAAMVLELDEFLPQLGDLDLAEPDMIEASRINDTAYGFPGDFERAFHAVPVEPAHLYLARLDGVPACTALTYEADGECGLYLVATLPEARGRGLAGALTSRALVDARERGSTTSSLQATKRGRPVYERLGYRAIGSLQMWERRRPPADDPGDA